MRHRLIKLGILHFGSRTIRPIVWSPYRLTKRAEMPSLASAGNQALGGLVVRQDRKVSRGTPAKRSPLASPAQLVQGVHRGWQARKGRKDLREVKESGAHQDRRVRQELPVLKGRKETWDRPDHWDRRGLQAQPEPLCGSSSRHAPQATVASLVVQATNTQSAAVAIPLIALASTNTASLASQLQKIGMPAGPAPSARRGDGGGRLEFRAVVFCEPRNEEP